MRKIFMLGVLAVLSACHTSKKSMLVGADVDEHGCRASAGYVWSEVKKDCIRVFEEGVMLTQMQNPGATVAAYLVFSTDASRVEVFRVENKRNPVLKREGDSWSDGTYRVVLQEGIYTLYKNGRCIYKQL